MANSAEKLGQLFSAVKKGTVTNTVSSSTDAANWIMTNLYDTESFKGENRTLILAAIRQAQAHYKGDI